VSPETGLIATIALALALAGGFVATRLGLPAIVGYLLAGLVVGESDLSHQAAADALPLRDAFAVLFFVSVGMRFGPAILVTNLGQVLVALALVVVAKPLAAFLIVAVLGHPVLVGLVVGAGLAQIGEFSFILAELGRTLGLLPQEGYGLILAGALLSITLNPLHFRTVDPLEAWLRRRPRLAARARRGPAPAGGRPGSGVAAPA
jgi:CPA2 family monovalent cation:H+ antiporter-2